MDRRCEVKETCPEVEEEHARVVQLLEERDAAIERAERAEAALRKRSIDRRVEADNRVVELNTKLAACSAMACMNTRDLCDASGKVDQLHDSQALQDVRAVVMENVNLRDRVKDMEGLLAAAYKEIERLGWSMKASRRAGIVDVQRKANDELRAEIDRLKNVLEQLRTPGDGS